MVETWYDLAVRELSDLTDPAKERLSEAEESSGVAPDPDATAPLRPSTSADALGTSPCKGSMPSPGGPPPFVDAVT